MVGWRHLLGGSVIVVFGTAIANVLNFVFSFVMARQLSPEAFATLTACLSIVIVATVPSGTLQLVSARFSAIWYVASPERAQRLAESLSRFSIVLGIVAGGAIAALARPLQSYLQIPGVQPLVVVSCLLAVSFTGPVWRGLLQGQHRFAAFIGSTIVDASMRLVAGFLGVAVGLQAAGAIGGILVGAVVGSAIAWLSSRSTPRSRLVNDIPWVEIGRWSLPTLLVQVSLAALLFQDTLLAKHFFSASDAGTYAGLATTSRILAYGPAALSAFIFPIIARAQGSRDLSRLVANLSLLVVAGGEIILLVIYKFLPGEVLSVVVGSQYAKEAGLLFPLALAVASYALIMVFVNYMMAIGGRFFWIVLLLAPFVEAMLLSLFHKALASFILSEDVTLGCTLAILAAMYFWKFKNPDRVRSRSEKGFESATSGRATENGELVSTVGQATADVS